MMTSPHNRLERFVHLVSASIIAMTMLISTTSSAQSELVFEPPTNLEPAPLAYAGEPAVASDGNGGFGVVWGSTNLLGGPFVIGHNILYSSSTDGVSWSAPVALNSNAGSSTITHYDDPKLAMDGAGNWVAVWTGTDDDIGEDTFISTTSDSGTTWTAPAHLNTGSACTASICLGQQIATDGAGAWVIVWFARQQLGANYYNTPYASWSNDNGATWSARIWLGQSFIGTSDIKPSLAAGGAGQFVVAWESDRELTATTGMSDDVFVRRSSNGGQTWNAVTAISSDAGNSALLDFRPTIAGDSSGNFIAAYTTLGLVGVRLIRSVVSTDAGATWGTPTILDGDILPQGQITDDRALIATDDAGNWTIAWERNGRSASPIGNEGDIASVVSVDDGANWSRPAPLNTTGVGDVQDDLLRAIAADGTGNWVTTWYTVADDIFVARAPGPTPLADADLDGLADQTEAPYHETDPADFDTDDDTLGDLDELLNALDPLDPDTDGDGALDGHEIYVASSDPLDYDSDDDFFPDGDETGSGSDPNSSSSIPPSALSYSVEDNIDGGAGADTGNDDEVQLVMDTTGVAIAAWKGRSDSGSLYGTDNDILFARSTDFGSTWSASTAINSYADIDGSSDHDYRIMIGTDGQGTYVATWASDYDLGLGTGGDQEVLFSRSVDSGVTWTAAQVLNLNAFTDISGDWVMSLGTNYNGVWICGFRSGDSLGGTIGTDQDILYSRSTDNGLTWGPVIALGTNAAIDSGYDRDLRLTTDRLGNWVATWTSYDSLGGTIGTDGDVLVSRSTDEGLSWSAPVPLHSDADVDVVNNIASDVLTDRSGTWIAVTYNSINTIRVTRSTDLGATWSEALELDTVAANTEGVHDVPKLTTDRAGNWIVSYESRELSGETYYGTDADIMSIRSEDDGLTWSQPVQVNTNARTDSGTDTNPRLATDEQGHWLAAWTTTSPLSGGSGSDQDIAFATAEGPDSDGDGLFDWEEVSVYGTDPRAVDSDGDTLSDWDEIFIHGTDPTAADSDNDDLTDDVEIATHGTDPNLFDTDGDGAGDGYEIASGTDPLDSESFPALPVPGLPLVALGVLSLFLMICGRRSL